MPPTIAPAPQTADKKPATPAAATPPAPAAAATRPDTGMSDAFKDLEALGNPQPPKPSVEEDDDPTPEDATPPTDTKETKEPEPARPKDKKASMAEFRSSYDKVKQERDELRAQLEEAKKAKPPEDPEKPKLKETLAERDKRLAELEDKIRFVDYEKSSEYQEKYHKPLADAYAQAWREVEQLLVTEADGTERVGKPEDFNKLMELPLAEAIRWAKDKFGDASTEVLSHRRALVGLGRSRQEALERFRKEGGERERKQAEERAAQERAASESYDNTKKELLEKYPKWFAPDDTDPDGNKLLEDGFKVVNTVFSPNHGLPPEQLARYHAEIAHRAAGFGRLAHQNNKLVEEVKGLRDQIAKLKGSDPGAGDAGAPDGAGRDKDPSVDDDLMAAAKGRL